MRIIFLGTRGFPDVQGGVEKHCENLTVNLASLGIEVIVFTRKPYVDPDLKEYKGVKLIPVPTIKNKYLETIIHTFIGIIKAVRYNPDIVHVHGIGPGIVIPFGKLLGLKFVLTTHGSNYKHLKWGFVSRFFLRMCEYISVKFCDEVIAVSEPISEEITRKYCTKATVIPNGVTMPIPLNTTDYIDKLLIEKKKYILTVGRLVPEKGFHNLINAFNSLELQDWKLVIVGAEDHKSKYGKQIHTLAEYNRNIIFTGFLTGFPLQELYENAGVFVLPSYYEGLPIVLLEAMSFNLPCIASDISANRSVHLPERCYFRTEDIEQLKQRLIEISSDYYSSEEILDNREKLLKNYSWNSITNKTLEIYKNVYKEAPKKAIETG